MGKQPRLRIKPMRQIGRRQQLPRVLLFAGYPLAPVANTGQQAAENGPISQEDLLQRKVAGMEE